MAASQQNRSTKSGRCPTCGTAMLKQNFGNAAIYCPLCASVVRLFDACVEAHRFIEYHPNLRGCRETAIPLDKLAQAILLASGKAPDRWVQDMFAELKKRRETHAST